MKRPGSLAADTISEVAWERSLRHCVKSAEIPADRSMTEKWWPSQCCGPALYLYAL